MTFDQAYQKYITARAELRNVQGALTKAIAAAEGLNIEIKQLSKNYARLHRNLVAAQLALKPELDKEVASAMKPEKFEPAMREEARKVAEVGKRPGGDSKASIPRADDPESIKKIATDTALQEIARKQTAETKSEPDYSDAINNGKADQNGT